MARRRVVITGLGIVSPVGNSVTEAWQNVVAGRSGIGSITRFDASAFPVQIAGEVRGFDVAKYLSLKEARRMDVFIHYGMAAGIEAIRDAGLDGQHVAPERIGVSIGSGIGGLPMIESTCDDFAAGGVRKVSPFFVPGSIINMISGNLSIMCGYKGPNISLVSACSTGTHSIGDAGRLIGLAWGASARRVRYRRATTTRRRQAAPGTGIATASCSVKGRVSWCLRSMSMRRRVVPGSTANWPVSA